MYLLYRHRWNTRIFPVTKIWYPVKIQFLSFTCEDMAVVMATSVSANRKTASQHLAISVFIINRILHACLWIQIFLLMFNSISHEWAQQTSEISSWTLEDKICIHAHAFNILYIHIFIYIHFKWIFNHTFYRFLPLRDRCWDHWA